MPKHTTKKKLTLKTHTLRQLTAAALLEALGGVAVDDESCCCKTEYISCVAICDLK